MRRKQLLAYTLIELLVVVALVALLAALLCPVFAVARRAARNAVCTHNLHQQGLALSIYLDDDDQVFPWITFDWSGPDGTERSQQQSPTSYPNVFAHYATKPVFRCPNDTGATNGFERTQLIDSNYDRWGTSYRPAAELGLEKMTRTDIPDPTAIFWASDATGYWGTKFWRPPVSGEVDDTDSRNDMSRWQNTSVFIDGHIRTVPFYQGVWHPYLALIGP